MCLGEITVRRQTSLYKVQSYLEAQSRRSVGVCVLTPIVINDISQM